MGTQSSKGSTVSRHNALKQQHTTRVANTRPTTHTRSIHTTLKVFNNLGPGKPKTDSQLEQTRPGPDSAVV
jgi:hypothetical protein